MILAAVGGIAFLVWTLPRQLDAILSNQKTISERATVIERRVTQAEEEIQGIGNRVTRLESK